MAKFDLSEDTRKYLQHEFSRLSGSSRDHVTAEQLGQCLKSVGIVLLDEDLEGLKKKFDKDGDGKLSIAEVLDNLGIIQAHCLKRDELLEAFSKFDVNKTGFLRLPHMLKILTFNDFMPVQEARQFLDRLTRTYDKNHDGRFDYGEFVEMYMLEDAFEKFAEHSKEEEQ